jgi:hypothetical protein
MLSHLTLTQIGSMTNAWTEIKFPLLGKSSGKRAWQP